MPALVGRDSVDSSLRPGVGTSPPHVSLDQEGVLLELAGLHLIPHPARGGAAARPGHLRVFLAAVLRGDLAALQGRSLWAAGLAATLHGSSAIRSHERRELLLHLVSPLGENDADVIAEPEQRFDRQGGQAFGSRHKCLLLKWERLYTLGKRV